MPKIYTKDGTYLCEKCKDDTYKEVEADELTPQICDHCATFIN